MLPPEVLARISNFSGTVIVYLASRRWNPRQIFQVGEDSDLDLTVTVWPSWVMRTGRSLKKASSSSLLPRETRRVT